MPRYAITEKAGRFVAGQSNTGVGSVLVLTDKQAEHELRLGTLIALDRAPRASSRREDPVEQPAMAEPEVAEQAAQEAAPLATGPDTEAPEVFHTTRRRRGKRQE